MTVLILITDNVNAAVRNVSTSIYWGPTMPLVQCQRLHVTDKNDLQKVNKNMFICIDDSY
jgi:hypothetical protein